MPCTPVTISDGVRAIVCTRGPRPHCACGKPATLQCDAPSKRKSGTCDRHLCAGCAVEVGPDRHLCPAHASIDGSATPKPHQDKPVAPVQEGLF